MDNKERKIGVAWALVPLVTMIVIMILTIVVFEGEPHIPVIIGTALAGIVAWKHGYTWGEIQVPCLVPRVR